MYIYTGWLGKAFCEALAEAGCTIIVSSRSREKAQAAAAVLPTPAGQKHFGVELDHMDEDSLKKGFAEAVEVAGQVDILVNNGLEGIELAQGKKLDIASTTFEQFSRHQMNNAGYFALARELRDHVVSRGVGGSVINIGSMYGQVASYPDAYAGLPYSSPVAYVFDSWLIRAFFDVSGLILFSRDCCIILSSGTTHSRAAPCI